MQNSLNTFTVFITSQALLSFKLKTFELKKVANSVEKEMIYIKGGNDYFDNYPISVAIEKQILKVINKIKNY